MTDAHTATQAVQNLHLTYFDLGVLAVMGFSCLFAFFRGFVREILSLGAWVGAGLVTIYFFPQVAKAMEQHVKNPTVAAGMATLGLYIGALLIFTMINMLIMRFLKEGKEVGVTDNLLGLLFGAIRGAFLVSLAYLVMTMALTEEQYPEWLKKAYTRPYVEKGAVVLAKAAPGYMQEMTSLKEKVEGRLKGDSGKPGQPRESDTQMEEFLKQLHPSGENVPREEP